MSPSRITHYLETHIKKITLSDDAEGAKLGQATYATYQIFDLGQIVVIKSELQEYPNPFWGALQQTTQVMAGLGPATALSVTCDTPSQESQPGQLGPGGTESQSVLLLLLCHQC